MRSLDIHGSNPLRASRACAIWWRRCTIKPTAPHRGSASAAVHASRIRWCAISRNSAHPKGQPRGPGAITGRCVWTVGFAGGGVQGDASIGEERRNRRLPGEEAARPRETSWPRSINRSALDLETELPAAAGPSLSRDRPRLRCPSRTVLKVFRPALLWLLAAGSLTAAKRLRFKVRRGVVSRSTPSQRPRFAIKCSRSRRFGCSAGACHGAAPARADSSFVRATMTWAIISRSRVLARPPRVRG